jgi:Flp pilus assembly protein TadG
MIKNEKGQALVEVALILPILLLLLIGMFDFGRTLYSYAHLHMAAQETVRLGGLGKMDSHMDSFARSYIHIGDPSMLSVQITPTEINRRSGEYVTVTLEYPVNLITPFIDDLLSSPFTISTNSTIRVE